MSSKPIRLQLSRKKGFNLQELSKAINGLSCIVVSRPSLWGNPHDTVKEYEKHLWINWDLQKLLPTLKDKNLACWCPILRKELYVECHADILLSMANNISLEKVQNENIKAYYKARHLQEECHADVLLKLANKGRKK